MGRQLVRVASDAGHTISGGSERPGCEVLGEDIGLLAGRPPLGRVTTAEISQAASGANVWIDFTAPQATLQALEQLPELGVQAAIIGTTGFSPQDEHILAQAASRLALVRSGNFSLGINLLEALIREAAYRLGPDWDIEVLETHHKHKMDAPSGTALMLGAAAAKGRGMPLKTLQAGPYHGPAAPRKPGQIGFAVRRSGGVIGEHEVTFASDEEYLSLSHTALDRCVFAKGAVRAAEWAAGQPPGLYTLSDVLGLTVRPGEA